MQLTISLTTHRPLRTYGWRPGCLSVRALPSHLSSYGACPAPAVAARPSARAGPAHAEPASPRREASAGTCRGRARGSGDKLFITTSGIGIIEHALTIAADQAQVGDCIILSGTIADHGMAVMSKREGLEFETESVSDTVALNSLVATMLEESAAIHCLRDPTRGGVATTLHEIARRSQVGIVLEEQCIPIREEVKGACELLGIDPLYVVNEGKLVAIVGREAAEKVVQRMRGHRDGQAARIIGEVVADHPGMVVIRTGIGGSRIIDLPLGASTARCGRNSDAGCGSHDGCH